MSTFISSSIKQFEYYRLLGFKTIERLSEEQLFWSPNNESNSMAVMVKHLWGNMLSRWTNFRTEDGEKPWRNRDQEFEQDIKSKEELIAKWNEGWNCLMDALNNIGENEAEELVYIRNQGHTITEAIQRQLGHYSYHIGQMVYLGKTILDHEWESLSIPKGDSKVYNEVKFNQEKSRTHFSDEYLRNK